MNRDAKVLLIGAAWFFNTASLVMLSVALFLLALATVQHSLIAAFSIEPVNWNGTNAGRMILAHYAIVLLLYVIYKLRDYLPRGYF